MSQATECTPSPDFDRRMWFDYVGKINDRDLQSGKVSGATTWVLLVVAAGLLYGSVPLIPTFLRVPNCLTYTTAFTLFQADLAFCILAFYAYIANGFASEGRVVPERVTRSRTKFLVGSIVLVGLASALHIGASRFALLPKLARGIFLIVGMWLALNTVAFIVITVRRKRVETKHNTTLAVFDSPSKYSATQWIIFVCLCIFASLSLMGFACITYILQVRGVDWVTPLGAGTRIVILAGILITLTFRAYRGNTNAAFRQLERDILVDQLSAAEIRDRYISQLVGPTVAEWLRKLGGTVAECQHEIQASVEKSTDALHEAQVIDPIYQLERRGRAHKALEVITAALKKTSDTLLKVDLQLSELQKITVPKSQQTAFRTVITEWRGLITRLDESMRPLQALVSHLEDLAGLSSGSSEASRLVHRMGTLQGGNERRGAAAGASDS